MKKNLLVLLSLLVIASMALAACGGGGSATEEASGTKLAVGIVLPTKDEPRWVQDETRFKEALTAAGYDVEILFSQGDSAKEKANVEALIAKGVKVIILTPQDGAAAAAAAETARAAGVKVISYDRLIRDTDAVDFYVTFDSISVGAAQAQYLVDHAEGTGNPLYLYAGAASDNNAFLFFEGAWNVLQPKIADGTFVIANSSEAEGLKDKATLTRDEQAAIIGQVTTNWDFNTAKTLAESNLTANGADAKGDVFILAPNDGTARAIADAFAADADVSNYFVTGQDAEKASVQYIIDGKQSMTVFKDVRTLVDDAIKAAVTFLEGGTPESTNSYNNGKVDVPANPTVVITVDQANVQSALIDSGYYSASDFTGLGGESSAPAGEPVTITFWEQEGEDVDVFIDQLIADFQAANPNITVERTHYENEALRDQFQTASLADAAADVVRVPNDFAGPFSTLEIIAPADALFDDAFLGQFFPGSLDPAKVGGTLWGVPDNYGNHLMLIYNKSLIAEPPATFEELITVSKELTTGDVQGFAYNLNEPFWGAGFYGAFGGWPLDENDQPQFNNQAFIDYLTFVAQLKSDGVVPAECDYACADTLMKEGKAAMIINGDWSLGDYTTALGDNLGVAPVPTINGNPYTEMTAGKYFMVSKAVLDDAAKQEAVTAFITYMTSAEVQKMWLDEFKRLPSNAEVAKDPSIESDPILAGSMADLAVGRGQPAAPEMRCAWDAWRPNLEGVMAGTLTPEDAAAAAQESADACVATLK